jgi:allantoate deiminase
MLGVITPISCVKALHENGERLPFAIEVFAFGDEEGVRYGTSFVGSAAVAGNFDADCLMRLDDDGISMDQALRDFGLDPAKIPAIARKAEDVLAYVELHIEQGPVLEAEGLPVGIVTSIVGGTRLSVAISGVAGHAGTVPMVRRHDALTAASEAVLAIERRCSVQDGLVGTVGRLAVEPDAINVIPGVVRFTIDIRAPENAVRDAAVADVRAEIEALCARRDVNLDLDQANQSDASVCTPWIIDQIEGAVAGEGIAPRRLYSGAGHDAQAFDSLTDIGMLFVRCKDGISHNPAEAITAADAGTAARVMLRFIRGFEAP